MLTNAAGGITEGLAVGQPVLIADHINLTGGSPVAGTMPADGVPIRFVDLTDAYSPRLRALAREVDPTLVEGVYAGLPGPHFETPAEIRMLRLLGADLVGMSTVWETIAARHLGLEVLAPVARDQPGRGADGRAVRTTTRCSRRGGWPLSGWAPCSPTWWAGCDGVRCRPGAWRAR